MQKAQFLQSQTVLANYHKNYKQFKDVIKVLSDPSCQLKGLRELFLAIWQANIKLCKLDFVTPQRKKFDSIRPRKMSSI